MLSKEDVLKIAKLSKLEFSENEIEKFRTDLNKIFDHMEELNSVDTTDVEPLFNVLDLKDVLRKDVVKDSGIKKDILKNSPNSDDEFIIVPKVVGENADNQNVLKNIGLVEFLKNGSLKIGREKIFLKIEIFRYILEKIRKVEK